MFLGYLPGLLVRDLSSGLSLGVGFLGMACATLLTVFASADKLKTWIKFPSSPIPGIQPPYSRAAQWRRYRRCGSEKRSWLPQTDMTAGLPGTSFVRCIRTAAMVFLAGDMAFWFMLKATTVCGELVIPLSRQLDIRVTTGIGIFVHE